MLKREGLMQMITNTAQNLDRRFSIQFIELKNYHSDDMEDDCTMVLVDIKLIFPKSSKSKATLHQTPSHLYSVAQCVLQKQSQL